VKLLTIPYRHLYPSVLGPRFEENFRRTMLISRGDLRIFIERPISAVLIRLRVLLIAGLVYVRLRRKPRSLHPLPPECFQDGGCINFVDREVVENRKSEA
jgi:TctA family transporter